MSWKIECGGEVAAVKGSIARQVAALRTLDQPNLDELDRTRSLLTSLLEKIDARAGVTVSASLYVDEDETGRSFAGFTISVWPIDNFVVSEP
jgi:hypothetical protein